MARKKKRQGARGGAKHKGPPAKGGGSFARTPPILCATCNDKHGAAVRRTYEGLERATKEADSAKRKLGSARRRLKEAERANQAAQHALNQSWQEIIAHLRERETHGAFIEATAHRLKGLKDRPRIFILLDVGEVAIGTLTAGIGPGVSVVNRVVQRRHHEKKIDDILQTLGRGAPKSKLIDAADVFPPAVEFVFSPKILKTVGDAVKAAFT